MKLLYVSGKYRGKTDAEVDENIEAAKRVAVKLWEAGFAVICPHLNTARFERVSDLTAQDYIAGDLVMIERCDGLVMLDGWESSQGAEREWKHAMNSGLPIWIESQLPPEHRPVWECGTMSWGGTKHLRLYEPPSDTDRVQSAKESFASALGVDAATVDAAMDANKLGDQRFHAVLDEMSKLHSRKSQDYGSDADPFANIRASADIGIPPWKGAWLRAKDKVRRIDQYCVRGTLANEGVEDSFIDLAAYALIALVLFRESNESNEKAKLACE